MAALFVVLVAAGLIGWQLPAALDRSARAAEVARLNTQLVGLEAQTSAVAVHQERLRTNLDVVSAENDTLNQRIALQRNEISALKQDIKRLKAR